MKPAILFLFALSATLLTGVAAASDKPVIPYSTNAEVDKSYTIIWYGSGKAYWNNDGQWVRAESYDYQFDVIQRRYDKVWKSIKSMHRIHPEYDGNAGGRDQTMYFEVAYKKLDQKRVQSVITSSLGNGSGTSDKEFRKSQLTIDADTSGPAAELYNRYRITQTYNYEKGLLTETVELLLVKDGKEHVFMKNEETAYFFVKGKLHKAPTVFR